VVRAQALNASCGLEDFSTLGGLDDVALHRERKSRRALDMDTDGIMIIMQ
jgi:hypothetical protein